MGSKPEKNEEEALLELNNQCINLSRQLKKSEEIQGGYLFTIKSLLFLLLLAFSATFYFAYLKSSVEHKYAMVDEEGRIFKFTMYDDPYLTPQDRIAFVERVVRAVHSFSYRDREEVLSRYSIYFSEDVFDSFLLSLKNDDLLNKSYVNLNYVTTNATILEPGRRVGKDVDGVSGKVFSEKIAVPIKQEIREKGVLVQTYQAIVYVNIARENPAKSANGYVIINMVTEPI